MGQAALEEISVVNVRNIQDARIRPAPGFNILMGENGSGKTGFLEGIHLLSSGRSFRTLQGRKVIRHGEAFCRVTGVLRESMDRLGLEKFADGNARIRVNGESEKGYSALAERLAVQVLEPGALQLVDGSPKGRRQLLDWGVFHVEHGFLRVWQEVNTLLKHRNAILRNGIIDYKLLKSWDEQWVAVAYRLDVYRSHYVDRLTAVFLNVLENLDNRLSITLSYYRGWSSHADLASLLEASIERDRRLGYTATGPHRADLKVLTGSTHRLAADVLSRGEKKTVVYALRLAQLALMQEMTQKASVLLVDDLAAELDGDHQQNFCALVDKLGLQVFMTCVDQRSANLLERYGSAAASAMFHVEHGKFTSTEPETVLIP